MTHRRQDIRAAIAAALDALPTLAGRVATNRPRPTQQAEELPCAIVYTPREASAPAAVKTTLSRALTVIIEIRAAAPDALDDTLDSLAEAVEAALVADPGFGRSALTSYLAGTSLDMDDGGEAVVGVLSLELAVTYHTRSGA